MQAYDPWRRTPIPKRRRVRIPVRRPGDPPRPPQEEIIEAEPPLIPPPSPSSPPEEPIQASNIPPLPTKTTEEENEDIWKERYLRLQADLANTRQRLQKRYEDEATQQVQRLISDLLPVVDNLQAALTHADDTDPEHLRQGVELTLRAFLSTLSQYGVTPIEAQGKPFDPQQHEALGHLSTADVPAGHVAKVLQNGYMIQDRLLRPAKVLVAA